MNNDSGLKELFRKSPHSDLCRKDAARVLHTYRDLRPERKKFVYNDGKAVDLTALSGTIPIMYKGATYNIPVCIWLQENHPFIPPLVYVMPTATMAIKPNKHVDANGRVYLPFLHEWMHPRSDLAALVQILCCVFAEQPPVYARQTPAPPPTQGPRFGYSPQQGSPYGGFPNAVNTPYPNRPPSQMPYPMPGGSPAPYPPYPTNVGPNPPYPAATQAYRPPNQTYPGTTPVTAGATTSVEAFRLPTQQMPGTAVAAGAATTSARPLSSQSSISEDMIKSSLVSAVEDKLRRQIKATFEQAQMEQNELMKTQHELRKGSEKLEDMLQKLQKEQDDVNNNIKLLTQKNEEIAEIVTKLESESSELDIDEAVITTAPLYNQILNLFAEENAVEDTIYYLSEGLRKEAISVEVFLKHVRTLSRKQFMLRALLQKARKTAGLS